MEWCLCVCLVVNNVKMTEPIGFLLREFQYIRTKHKRVLIHFKAVSFIVITNLIAYYRNLIKF